MIHADAFLNLSICSAGGKARRDKRAMAKGSMSIRKSLIRIWLALSLISILIDVACFWLVQHSRAPLPGNYTFNYIMIFLISAPAPIALAIVLTILGGVLAILRWIWIVLRRAAHQRPAEDVLSRHVEKAFKTIKNQNVGSAIAE